MTSTQTRWVGYIPFEKAGVLIINRHSLPLWEHRSPFSFQHSSVQLWINSTDTIWWRYRITHGNKSRCRGFMEKMSEDCIGVVLSQFSLLNASVISQHSSHVGFGHSLHCKSCYMPDESGDVTKMIWCSCKHGFWVQPSDRFFFVFRLNSK